MTGCSLMTVDILLESTSYSARSPPWRFQAVAILLGECWRFQVSFSRVRGPLAQFSLSLVSAAISVVL